MPPRTFTCLTTVVAAAVLGSALRAEPATAPGRSGSGQSVCIAICQMAARDGKIDANLAVAAEQVKQAAAAGAVLCVFPELIDVGFGDIVKASASDLPLAQPIPGPTSRRLGEIARANGVWILVAILEKVPGGAYDTNVILDSTGQVVHKQRKCFVYPAFAGTTACFTTPLGVGRRRRAESTTGRSASDGSDPEGWGWTACWTTSASTHAR